MGANSFAQLVDLAGGVLLLSGILIVWRRSISANIRFLSIQGVSLGALVVFIGGHERSVELATVGVFVLILKGVILPGVLSRTVKRTGTTQRESPLINTTASLVFVSVLTTLAFLLSQPLQAPGSGPARSAAPVGVALVLYGFIVLSTRRHAISQLIGFLMLDNGIATVAFLMTGGVPLVVELGASLDVVLVVLILQVLTVRIRTEFGQVDLDELNELRD